MPAIAGEGTGMERDYDFSSALHAADLEAPEKIGRSAGERAVARLNPRKVDDAQGAGGVRPARRRLAGRRIWPAPSTARRSRARRASCKDKHGRARCFADGIRIIDDPLRKRGLRSRPFDGEGVAGKTLALIEDGVLQILAARLRDRARTRPRHHRARARGVSSTPSPGPTNLHLEAGHADAPSELIADIEDGFYVTDLIGMGANMVTGDYSRGASGFWIENGKRTYPVSEVTIAGHLLDIFRIADAGERSRIPLRHQRADLAAGGADRCRHLSSSALREPARGRRCARPARSRQDTFAGAAQALDQGQGDSPVSEADIAVNDLLHERLTALEPGDGWLSEESEDDPARLARAPRLGGRSDRRHARLHRRPRRTGRSRSRWSRTAGRCSPRSSRR